MGFLDGLNPLQAMSGTLGANGAQIGGVTSGPLTPGYGPRTPSPGGVGGQATPLAAFQSASQPSPQQAANFAQNLPFLRPGASNFNTTLPPLQESQFQNWAGQNNIPFGNGAQNYDIRGLFQGLMNGHPAAQGFDPSSGSFPHNWTTPFSNAFSNLSQWAMPHAPNATGAGWLRDR